MNAKDKAVLWIAQHHFDIETLAVRGMDRLDFHEVSVTGMKQALEAAYDAGVRAANKKAAKAAAK